MYLFSRWVLRSLLSERLNCIGPELCFDYSTHGKPYVCSPSTFSSFNISHSKDCLTIAISSEGQVGVDVEWVGKNRSFVGIADRYFCSQEAADIRRAESQSLQKSMFYRYWVLKEALLKMSAHGISGGLDSVLIEFHIERLLVNGCLFEGDYMCFAFEDFFIAAVVSSAIDS